jgi:hypothetical protein
MKLITEINEEVNYLTEATEAGGKNYFIEGIFMQGNIKNRNGRVYPTEVLDKEVARYNKEYVQKKRAYGELGHPSGPTINLERVSHMITKLDRDGDNYVGRAKIMTETPYGAIVKSLMDEGATLGVSSRGMGSLKQSKAGIAEVQNDFYLATAGDIVADPSAPNAFVEGIMEGAEWVFNEATNSWQQLEAADQMRKEMRKMSVQEVEAKKFAMFEQFMNSLIK